MTWKAKNPNYSSSLSWVWLDKKINRVNNLFQSCKMFLDDDCCLEAFIFCFVFVCLFCLFVFFLGGGGIVCYTRIDGSLRFRIRERRVKVKTKMGKAIVIRRLCFRCTKYTCCRTTKFSWKACCMYNRYSKIPVIIMGRGGFSMVFFWYDGSFQFFLWG